MRKLPALILSITLLLALAACGTPAPIPNPPLVLGEKYLSDLDYEQALLQFDQAIAIEPKNPRGYLGKADALLHLDRSADAASALSDGAKATGGDTRIALKAAQTEVAKSPVDGYIGLSSAYDKLGWREIALLLLQRVCEELPEEGRLREALEKLTGKIVDELNADQRNNETNMAPIVLPENVFGMKDVLECGITLDSDIYAIADKVGIPRNKVFLYEEVHTEDYHLPYIVEEDHDTPIDWVIACWPQYGGPTYGFGWIDIRNDIVSFDCGTYNHGFLPELIEKVQLIRGIGLGMRAEDVLRKFYYSEDAVMIENGELKRHPKNTSGDDSFMLYEFSGDSVTGRSSGRVSPYSTTYSGIDGSFTYDGYTITYEFIERGTNSRYVVDFNFLDGVVDSMKWTAYLYQEEAIP